MEMENCGTTIEYELPSADEIVKHEDIDELVSSEEDRNFENEESMCPEVSIELPIPDKEDEKNIEIKKDLDDEVQIIGCKTPSQIQALSNDMLTSTRTINYSERNSFVQNSYHSSGCDISTNPSFSSPEHISVLILSTSSAKPLARRYRCQLCPKSYLIEYDLNVHLYSHTYGKNLRCPTCEARFSNQDALHIHMTTHESMRPFKCDLCGRSFLKPHDLRVHGTQAHTPKRRFGCAICSKSFAYMSNLVVHVERDHAGAHRRTCYECGKLCESEESLKSHVDDHVIRTRENGDCQRDKTVERSEAKTVIKRERPFRCHLCGMDFVHVRHLENHLGYHGVTENKTEFPKMEQINEIKSENLIQL